MEDVTQEYMDNAEPGKGKIEYVDGYVKKNYPNEVKTAKWLHDTYGGNIKLLTEAQEFGIKVPDYEWNGKLWELKNTTTAKSANSAIRHGLKQIKGNPGGIILSYGSNDFVSEELQEVIGKRLSVSALFDVDIMILKDEKTVKIIRHKK